MKKSYPTFAMILLALAAQGCASGPKAVHCDNHDWHAVGMADGQQGKFDEFLDRRQAACAQTGVTLDVVAYRAGRDEGLVSFCTQKSAYQHGKADREYYYVCPKNVEENFLIAYKDGRRLHELEEIIQKSEWELRKIERNMNRYQVELRNYESDLSRANSRANQEIANREIQTLAVKIRQAQADRQSLSYTLATNKKALKNFLKARERERPAVTYRDD